jgi:hypothetical protein
MAMEITTTNSTILGKPENAGGVNSVPLQESETVTEHRISNAPVDTVSLTRSEHDEARQQTDSRQNTSKQVDRHEKNALLGKNYLQYSFPFYSDDERRLKSSPHASKSETRVKTSKPVTKNEKNALLDSSLNQYNFTFYG